MRKGIALMGEGRREGKNWKVCPQSQRRERVPGLPLSLFLSSLSVSSPRPICDGRRPHLSLCGKSHLTQRAQKGTHTSTWMRVAPSKGYDAASAAMSANLPKEFPFNQSRSGCSRALEEASKGTKTTTVFRAFYEIRRKRKKARSLSLFLGRACVCLSLCVVFPAALEKFHLSRPFRRRPFFLDVFLPKGEGKEGRYDLILVLLYTEKE